MSAEKVAHTPGPRWTGARYDGAEMGCAIIAANTDRGPLPGNPTRGQSECSGCNGTGLMSRHIEGRDTQAAQDADDQPCDDCADIRAVIEKAEGGA